MSRTHTPDFFAVTADERASGYSARCQLCGRLLLAGIEFIGSPCIDSPIHLEIVCPECRYIGPAALSIGDGPRTVTCPECHEEWEVTSTLDEGA